MRLQLGREQESDLRDADPVHTPAQTLASANTDELTTATIATVSLAAISQRRRA